MLIFLGRSRAIPSDKACSESRFHFVMLSFTITQSMPPEVIVDHDFVIGIIDDCRVAISSFPQEPCDCGGASGPAIKACEHCLVDPYRIPESDGIEGQYWFPGVAEGLVPQKTDGTRCHQVRAD